MGERSRSAGRKVTSLPYPPKIQEIVDTLALMPDRSDRIQALISLAKTFKPVPQTVAMQPYDEAHRVPGCESEAFAWVSSSDGRLALDFAVLNPQGISAMALAAVLKEGLDGEDASLAESLDDDLVFQLFGRELSMGKSLGLTNMTRMVRSRARSVSG